MKKVGFIGLGNMGLPMAANLLKAGIEINAFDISKESLQEAKKLGMNVKDSPNGVLENIDALITMLPSNNAVKDVFIEGDILEKLDKKVLVIESSTISPSLAKTVAEKAVLNEISVLDAPVSGGVKGAELGTLTFIVGGKKSDLEKASFLFDIMGDNIFYAGGSGSGQIAKLCNNMLLAIHMSGTAEVLAMGVNNGLDPETLSEIMRNSSGGNWSLEKYNPFPGVMEGVPASNNYNGGFLNVLMLKDLRLAEELSDQSKSDTPMGKLAKKLYEQLNDQGLGDLDFSSIQKNYLK
jgi:3-hydroxyisobutyrate dehydrogenase